MFRWNAAIVSRRTLGRSLGYSRLQSSRWHDTSAWNPIDGGWPQPLPLTAAANLQ
jgi:hypothetical protein